MTDEGFGKERFAAHVELLRLFLVNRAAAVEQIHDELNARRKPVQQLQDRTLLSQSIEDCLFNQPSISTAQAQLRGELETTHWASGFTPRQATGLHNDLIHPAEMMIRGLYCWHQSRWPGRNARMRYAHTLFNVYMLRCLALLSMRLWDAGPGDAASRLASIQSLLDELWRKSPEDQPALVRDARWLIPLAQSPTTDELTAYFDVAARIAATPAEQDRIEIQRAGVVMIGGHLRSQIRHYCVQDGLSIDERSVIARTRTSNALDFALLIQGLVPLLEAYDRALQNGLHEQRLSLASAVFQGISPDPELFLNRLDLLVPYSMIEYLFVATNSSGRPGYTPAGRRHLALTERYAALIGRLAGALDGDCANFRPRDGSCSPYGVIYGTPSNLAEHIALKAIQYPTETRFTLEDVFDDTRSSPDKLAWVNAWRALPHIPKEVQKLHEYPQSFAAAIFSRIERALAERAGADTARDGANTGRFIVRAGETFCTDLRTSANADSTRGAVRSSDSQLVADGAALAGDAAQLLRNRQEGHHVVSFAAPDGWVAISKDVLTDVLGAGIDVNISGLPGEAADVLRLTCPGMVSIEGEDEAQAPVPPSMLNA